MGSSPRSSAFQSRVERPWRLAKLGISPSSLAVEPTGRFLYARDSATSLTYGFAIAANGSIAQVGTPQATGGNAGGMTIIADLVYAVFECKLTLRPKHLAKFFERCAAVKAFLEEGRTGSPYCELHAQPFVGLLAHDADLGSSPAKAIREKIAELADEVDSPTLLPDVVCVASVGCWERFTVVEHTERHGLAIGTGYMSSDSGGPKPVGDLIRYLLRRLAREDPTTETLANYFRGVLELGASTGGTMRAWPSEVLSPDILAELPAERQRLRDQRVIFSRFDGWDQFVP